MTCSTGPPFPLGSTSANIGTPSLASQIALARCETIAGVPGCCGHDVTVAPAPAGCDRPAPGREASHQRGPGHPPSTGHRRTGESTVTSCGHRCCEIAGNSYHRHADPPETCARCTALAREIDAV